MQTRAAECIGRAGQSNQERAVYHYTWPFARLLVAKLACALKSGCHDGDRRAPLQDVATSIESTIRQTCDADGGWGTPLATACHLSVLATATRPFDPWPGVIYLASRQGPDGTWPAEPLYRCPGKDGFATAHGAAAMTTAGCFDALLDIKAFVSRAA